MQPHGRARRVGGDHQSATSCATGLLREAYRAGAMSGNGRHRRCRTRDWGLPASWHEAGGAIPDAAQDSERIGVRQTHSDRRDSAERQVPHLPFPFAVQTAFCQQEQILDGHSESQIGANLEHSRHATSVSYSLVSMICQRGSVMGDEDTVFPSGEVKDSGIIGSGQADILNANNVEIGAAAQQAAQDIVVEVLISGEAQHACYDLLSRRARSRARTPSGPNRASFRRRAPARSCCRSRRYSSTSVALRR